MNREKIMRASFFMCIAFDEKPSRRNVQKRIAEANGGKTFSTTEVAAFLLKLGTHTDVEWQRLLDLCGRRCVRCEHGGDIVYKDHIKLVSLGGSDAITNLQPLCVKCNCSKWHDCTDYVPAVIRQIMATEVVAQNGA